MEWDLLQRNFLNWITGHQSRINESSWKPRSSWIALFQLGSVRNTKKSRFKNQVTKVIWYLLFTWKKVQNKGDCRRAINRVLLDYYRGVTKVYRTVIFSEQFYSLKIPQDCLSSIMTKFISLLNLLKLEFILTLLR